MSYDDLPPDLMIYAQDVRDLLGLQEWAITFKLVDAIDDDPAVGGRVSYSEPYRWAHVFLRRDSTEAEFREFVMHELLHVALAPQEYAALTAIRLVPKPQQKLARTLVNDGGERAVTALAKALVRGLRPPPSP